MIMEYNGIKYDEPNVFLLQNTGVGMIEFAGRTAYNSFCSDGCVSDVKYLNDVLHTGRPDGMVANQAKKRVQSINKSELVEKLSRVYQHKSVLEHSILTYSVIGVSRGVLQELARHRIGVSLTVQSTRYTMHNVVNCFLASLKIKNGVDVFVKHMCKEDVLVTNDEFEVRELQYIHDQLMSHLILIGIREFEKISLPKSVIEKYEECTTFEEAIKVLKDDKKKKNMGDSFKYIVSDNWKTDLVVTFNLRSLDHFLSLRDSGAAWFQIRTLAEKIKNATPDYLLEVI